MVPVPVLAFVDFGPVQYWHGTLTLLALNGTSTGNVKEYCVKCHKIYASTSSIVPPLLGALLELVICLNWYPVVLYCSDNGSKKMPVRALIPIRLPAYSPLPVMGICAFWYQHLHIMGTPTHNRPASSPYRPGFNQHRGFRQQTLNLA